MAIVSNSHDAIHLKRLKHWRWGLWAATCCLALRVLYLILVDYWWYFPANFVESSFLTGRESFFHGAYKAAFYLHIVVSPISLVAAFVLMFSGTRPKQRRLHRLLGKSQFYMVLFVVVPTGLVMATRAYTGAVAGMGFATLSVVTGITMLMAAVTAAKRNFKSHRRWALRCFVLLCSPLILRLTSGLVIVLGFESGATYQLSAWLCWLVPLIVVELWSQSYRNR